MHDIFPVLILLVVFGFVAFMLWQRHQDRLQKRRLRAEAQARILDRIGPGEALTAFLQSEEGRTLLKSHESFDDPEIPSHRRYDGIRMSIIGLLTAGVICMGIALGFLVVSHAIVEEAFIVPAAIVGGVGVGCILAAVIHYVLGKAWGMLGSGADRDRSRSRPS